MREYNRTYYQRPDVKERRRKYVREYRKGATFQSSRKRKVLGFKFLSEMRRAQPCMDCGQSFPTRCMDFDHRPGETKKHQVASMVGLHKSFSTSAFIAEMNKCDVVCANCHRIRTHEREQC